MKKLFLLFVLFSVVSCNGDDEVQNASNKASIVGTWYVEKSDIYRSLNQNIQTSFSTDCEKTGTYEFTASHLISISLPKTIIHA